MVYLGDFKVGDTRSPMRDFPTVDASDAPITLVDGTVGVYKDDSTTPLTAGVTLTVDWNSFTGRNRAKVAIGSHPAVYTAGSYTITLLTGEVDGVDKSGWEIAQFSVGQYASISDIEEVVDIETGGLGQVTADRVPRECTFYVGSEGTQSRNIVKLNAWTSGTRTLAYDLTELLDQAETTINSISSVTVVSGATSVTTSELRKHQNQKVAMWDTAFIDSDDVGTYTVTVTVVTIDTNTITVTGTLEVE